MTTTATPGTTKVIDKTNTRDKKLRKSTNADVNRDVGEYLKFEIMADTAAEATATAEQLAFDSRVVINQQLIN